MRDEDICAAQFNLCCGWVGSGGELSSDLLWGFLQRKESYAY